MRRLFLGDLSATQELNFAVVFTQIYSMRVIYFVKILVYYFQSFYDIFTFNVVVIKLIIFLLPCLLD